MNTMEKTIVLPPLTDQTVRALRPANTHTEAYNHRNTHNNDAVLRVLIWHSLLTVPAVHTKSDTYFSVDKYAYADIYTYTSPGSIFPEGLLVTGYFK